MVDAVNGAGNNGNRPTFNLAPEEELAISGLENDIKSIEQFAIAVMLPSMMKSQARFRESMKEE